MKILVPVAHGSESLETVTIINVLRRAELDVTVASIEQDLTIAATRGIRIIADQHLTDTEGERFDLVALPGGEAGARALAGCTALIRMLQAQNDSKRLFAAICAAPALTLAPHGLLDGRCATCYPSFREYLANYVDEPVVVDRNCVTASGPGSALPFALKLVELLAGTRAASTVAQGMLVS